MTVPTVPAADQLGPVHFIGIGGAGMSGIARIMLDRGIRVSGSDAKDSRELAALAARGATVFVGHRAEQLGPAATVVISSAIRDSNVELVEARVRGLRVLHRAQALAAVMTGRRVVAVAGTHGKTTTTSMLTVALQHCGVDPSFAIGGELNESGANAHDGSGELFVAEADESDESFLHLSPFAAVVTNVDADHLDHYRTSAAYAEAFTRFADRLDPDGFLVTCVDDPGARRLAELVRAGGRRVVTYGEGADAQLRVERAAPGPAGSRFELFDGTVALGAVQLRVHGHHYVLDAAAAITAGLRLGFPFAGLAQGIAQFSGTRRRMEDKGGAAGVRVIDSYAHHPTEVAADLRAAREIAGEGRLVVAFQPHLFSRTRLFAAQLGQALGLADDVVVMDVYAAREDPEPGVTGALVARAVPLPTGQVHFEPSWTAVAPYLAQRARPGDLVLTLGAGDITLVGPEVVDLLRQREDRGDA
jgi:UDP-N-acetylmuramate--alanine ligase